LRGNSAKDGLFLLKFETPSSLRSNRLIAQSGERLPFADAWDCARRRSLMLAGAAGTARQPAPARLYRQAKGLIGAPTTGAVAWITGAEHKTRPILLILLILSQH